MNPISEAIKRIREMTSEQIAEMLVAKDERIAALEIYADFGRASADYFKALAEIRAWGSDE